MQNLRCLCADLFLCNQAHPLCFPLFGCVKRKSTSSKHIDSVFALTGETFVVNDDAPTASASYTVRSKNEFFISIINVARNVMLTSPISVRLPECENILPILATLDLKNERGSTSS